MKLHLGCGNKRIEGFLNIDVRYQPNVDYIDNIKFLRKTPNNSVELIYASHVLEHFSRWDYMSVLQRWYETIKPNGILRIAVPDFEQLCKYYIETKEIRKISGMLYGGQDYEQNYHYWCWDFISLKEDLEKIGFKNVTRYDWRLTEHCDIDDYSQSYFPHLDKKNGILMSLNIEATKP